MAHSDTYPPGRIESGVPIHELWICRQCGDDLYVTKTGRGIVCKSCDAPEEPDTR